MDGVHGYSFLRGEDSHPTCHVVHVVDHLGDLVVVQTPELEEGLLDAQEVVPDGKHIP